MLNELDGLLMILLIEIPESIDYISFINRNRIDK